MPAGAGRQGGRTVLLQQPQVTVVCRGQGQGMGDLGSPCDFNQRDQQRGQGVPLPSAGRYGSQPTSLPEDRVRGFGTPAAAEEVKGIGGVR